MSVIHMTPARKNTFAIFGTLIRDAPGDEKFGFEISEKLPVIAWRTETSEVREDEFITLVTPICFDGSLCKDNHIGYQIGKKFYDLEGFEAAGVI